MGSDQSNLARQQEYAREVAERENLRHTREEQLQETLRLERRNLYMKTLEAKQLQEALRRSTAEAHSQLYPNLNNTAGSSRNDTYQTTAAPNHSHLKFQPSAPPPPHVPTVLNPAGTHQPHQPRPCPPTIYKPASQATTIRASVTAPQAPTIRASVTAPQAPTIRASVTAPQAPTIRASVTAPQAPTIRASVQASHAATIRASVTPLHAATVRAAVTTFQATTIRASVTAPQALTNRASVQAPHAATVRAAMTEPQATTVGAAVTAPQATTVHAAMTAPQATTFYSAMTAPQASTVSASAAAPHEKKVFTRKDDSTLCKTCKKPYEDKIFQCKNGHSSCEGCWSLDLPCGVCRGPITNIRNFDLENYFMANQRVKCPNAAEGCILSLKKSEIPKHEKECPFRELKCPALVSCDWKGKISQLSIHFDEKHPFSRQANVDTEMFLPMMTTEYNSLQLIKMGTFNFLVYVKLSEMERKIYMDVQLIGTKATASKWNYEIHVYNKRQPRRKYQYNDTCRSSEETPTDISLRNCAVLHLPYAMSFVNEGTLSYKFFIKKNSKDKRN